mmetsp:Transcript_34825/g.31354  ORF Transcript_34825/g.31354 Transcript_34825/m.31354 type:complete len:130 (-) Transcript_34825:1845-2234(-)
MINNSMGEIPGEGETDIKTTHIVKNYEVVSNEFEDLDIAFNYSAQEGSHDTFIKEYNNFDDVNFKRSNSMNKHSDDSLLWRLDSVEEKRRPSILRHGSIFNPRRESLFKMLDGRRDSRFISPPRRNSIY